MRSRPIAASVPLTLVLVCAFALALALVAGCARVTEDGAPAPLSPRTPLRVAEQRVRAWVYDHNPSMNPAAQFPLRETTTDAVWDALHVQLFQLTAGPREFQTYLFRGDRIDPLGEGFGGYGVVSACAADVDGDGALDLAYSYSFGSGIHRSLVAYADVAAGAIVPHVAPETCYLFEDLRVGLGPGSDVLVTLSGVPIGRLVATDAPEGARIEFRDDYDPARLSADHW